MNSYGPYTGDTYEGSPEESHDMEAEAAASYAAAMEAENVNAMTEQDERAIYEWAYPGWQINVSIRVGLAWGVSEDGTERTLPRLDHNFAFDVCVPKLEKQCNVSYKHGHWDIQPWKRPYSPRWERPDFYDALLAYIRGVK